MVPMMNANGADAPAWLAISALMKMTPIVGEMNARLIAIALGKPIAFLLSRSPTGAGIAVAIRCPPPTF